MLEDTDAARANQTTELATSISELQDLDYAAAVSRMNQQFVGLQAAQQSYAKIGAAVAVQLPVGPDCDALDSLHPYRHFPRSSCLLRLR